VYVGELDGNVHADPALAALDSGNGRGNG